MPTSPAGGTENSTQAAPRRRWLRYSLRSLLLVTTALAVALGVWVGRAQRQRRALERVEALGGSYAYVPRAGSPDWRSWIGRRLGQHYVERVDYVQLTGSRAKDEDLEHLSALSGLRSLALQSTSITHEGLAHVAAIDSLEALYVGDTQITDAGLAHLRGLSHLREISFWKADVTDDGLVHLREMTSLRWLSLDSTDVTDAGLAHLRTMTWLEQLDLSNTLVTKAGVEELQKSLPHTVIIGP
jgi:hypothetical protein